MVKVTYEEIQNLAELSSLELTEAEAESLTDDLGRILTFVKQLDELDTSNVEPTYQVSERSNIWREDEVDQSQIAPHQLLELAEGGVVKNQIKVPKVL